jgi:hypothetical protein
MVFQPRALPSQKRKPQLRQTMFKRATALLAGLVVAGFCARSEAAATLTLYDGVSPLVSITDDGPGDLISGAGIIYVQTNIGVWYLSISSAVTKPVFGSATDPVMDLIIQANSSAAGTLRFTFSDNGFGPAAGTLHAIMDGHVISGAGVGVTYNVFGDPANVVGATTVPVTSIATTLPTTATANGTLALGAPYSLTQIITFTTTGATGFSADGSFNVVPEPSALALAGVGLGVLALRNFRRRQA